VPKGITYGNLGSFYSSETWYICFLLVNSQKDSDEKGTMIHIKETFSDTKYVCISVDGVLGRDSIRLLRSLCLDYINSKKEVTLLLKGLMHISRDGIDFLREIQGLVILEDPPPFLKINEPEKETREKA